MQARLVAQLPSAVARLPVLLLVPGDSAGLFSVNDMQIPCYLETMKDVVTYFMTDHPNDTYAWTTPLRCYVRASDHMVVRLPE